MIFIKELRDTQKRKEYLYFIINSVVPKGWTILESVCLKLIAPKLVVVQRFSLPEKCSADCLS